ncbi:MAG: hypothetical protein HYV33_01390 [Candidatus Kerfeldbacteria bacterium]|nr:hypothetical protein [Candidatus Kerfeldbacteria bacterium]
MNKDYKTRLLQQKQHIFHTQDLAVLWDITNKNTLYTTIKRYIQAGTLQPIYKSVYSTQPVDTLDARELGLIALHRFAYVSCETILIQHGIINQLNIMITLVSDQSRQFTIGEQRYRSRKLADRYLFNPAGIQMDGSVRVATLERAIIDMLYFNPRFHFDAPIALDKVNALRQVIGYPQL